MGVEECYYVYVGWAVAARILCVLCDEGDAALWNGGVSRSLSFASV